jgi:hypothetical protein
VVIELVRYPSSDPQRAHGPAPREARELASGRRKERDRKRRPLRSKATENDRSILPAILVQPPLYHLPLRRLCGQFQSFSNSRSAWDALSSRILAIVSTRTSLTDFCFPSGVK